MLEARGIRWQKNGKDILQGIDFNLAQGECTGLIGPNGSGKSSLLKILAFLERPTAGFLRFRGRSVPGTVPLEIRRKIAVVFQESLLLNCNVYDNVALSLKIRGMPKKEAQRRVISWLERFGVAHLQRQHARLLSGGEAQRVSLARAFVLEPDVLLLDEPFSALDAPTRESLLHDLAGVFRDTKTTTVLVSHEFRDIERLTQRASVMIDGQIVASGSPPDLLHTPQVGRATDFLSHWYA